MCSAVYINKKETFCIFGTFMFEAILKCARSLFMNKKRTFKTLLATKISNSALPYFRNKKRYNIETFFVMIEKCVFVTYFQYNRNTSLFFRNIFRKCVYVKMN